MPYKMKISATSIVIVINCTSISWSQSTIDYWPLEVGNRWVYNEVSGLTSNSDEASIRQDSILLEVISKSEVEGIVYFQLNNDLIIRRRENGDIVHYNADAGQNDPKELLIFDFSSPLSEIPPFGHIFYPPQFSVFLPFSGGRPFTPSAPRFYWYRGKSARSVDTPVGIFEDTFTFSFGPDDGVMNMTFANGIGPIVSSINSDISFTRYQLIEITLNGTTLKRETIVELKGWGGIKQTTLVHNLE